MSAREVLVAGVVARLRALPGLAGCAVFDAPPVRAGLPHAVVEEPVLADWGAKDWTGREGRLVVTLADAGERPVRLRVLLDAVEAGVPGMATLSGGGWRVVQLRLVRSRIARRGGSEAAGWSGTAEFLVRMADV